MIYKQTTFWGSEGWHVVDMPSLTQGQRLSIIPMGCGQLSPELNLQPKTIVENIFTVGDDQAKNQPGFYSGTSITSGQVVTIQTTGTWFYSSSAQCTADGLGTRKDADTLNSNAITCSLLYKIGDASWKEAGSDIAFVADNDGELWFAMNDRKGQFGDNKGGTMQIEVRTGGRDCSNRILPTEPDNILLARYDFGNAFSIGEQFDSIGQESGKLHLCANGCSDNYFSALVIVDAPNPSENDSSCEDGGHTQEPTSTNPIKLRTGTKISSSTDLGLNTPAGMLSFTHNYNQDRLNDANYAYMGLGWSHNHHHKLQLTGNSPNRVAEIHMPDGGVLKLDEDGIGGDFDVKKGSTSTLDYDAVAGEYILTTQNKTLFVFDETNNLLLRRHWPNAETWTYVHDGNNRLSQVSDGYGRSLNFSYYPSGDFRSGQLWRVGDHTAAGLDTSTPSGRFVTLDYITAKPDNPQKALLAKVTDTLGQDWTYHYYGQQSGETDTNKLNFLTQRISPSVDTDGDGSPNQTLTLEDLTYTTDGSGTITQIDQSRAEGLIDTQYVFQPAGDNVTEETTAGKKTIHHFANGVYVGPTNPASILASWQAIGSDYRAEAQGDANGNQTQLTWSTNGKHLDNITDALSNTTAFNYDTDDRLTDSTDAQGRKTEYTYGDSNNPRQPTVIKVFDTDGTTLLRQQEFVYDSNGRTTEERDIDPSDGVSILRKTNRTYYSSGNGNGLMESLTQNSHVPADQQTTTYTYDSAGRVVKTQKSSVFGSCQFSYTVYDEAGNVLATACGRYGATPPTTVPEAIALYDANDPVKKDTKVTTHEYDALGRRVASTTNAGTAWAQTSRTMYDALDRVWRTISNYIQQGSSAPGDWIWDTVDQRWEDGAGNAIDHGTDHSHNLISETFYNARGQVRGQQDALGNVTLYGYDDADRLVKTIQNSSNPGYDNDYTGDPDLSDYGAGSGNSDEDIITEQAYDPAGNLVKTIDAAGSVTFMVYDALNRPVVTVRNAKHAATISGNTGDAGYDATNDPRTLYDPDSLLSVVYTPSTASDRDHISKTTYDEMGRVVTQTGEDGQITYSVYDALGRNVRTIRNYVAQNDTDPADWFYDGAWQQSAADTTAIDHGTANDQNLITETVYNAAGQVEYTLDVERNKSYFVYDGLGRTTMTIANYEAQTTTPDQWVWDAIDGRWEDGSNAAIDHGSNGDLNRIVLTEYDDDGRVKGRQDTLGNWSLFGYDDQSRQVRTIQHASNPSYDMVTDPDLSDYTVSTDPDQDIVTDTVYGADGRVLYTVDINGNKNWTAYDDLGRQVKSIANAQGTATDGGANDPRSDSYVASTDPDKDVISKTVYDLAGRVQYTEDALGRQTYFVYDAAGRRIRTISNYVGQGSTDPSDWYWNSSTGQWQRGSGDTTPIVRYTSDPDNQDQNIINDTVYDAQGRVQQTRNERGQITYNVYDSAGRNVMTVRNYVAQATTPDQWVWDAAWEDGNNVAINHGTDNDQNVISTTTYDKAGRVVSNRNSAGEETVFVYDAAGRRIRTVSNYVAQATTPDQWVWDAAWEDGNNVVINHGTDNDQNVISETTYNQAGQVIATRNGRGTQTTFEYDRAGRRIKTIQDAGGPLETVSYTGYDTAGRVLRTIANYKPIRAGADIPAEAVDQDGFILPDAQDASGLWYFQPDRQGLGNDTNLITEYVYDKASRRIKVIDPMGNETLTTYFKDGQVESVTDPESTVSQYRYDELRRRRLVVQGYDHTEDPDDWDWSGTTWQDN